MRWQIAILILILACYGVSHHAQDTAGTTPFDGTSVLQSQLSRQRQERCGAKGEGDAQSRSGGLEGVGVCGLSSEVRVNENYLVEVPAIRLDALVDGARDEKTATVPATATPVPATQSAEATPLDDPYRACRAEFVWNCHYMLYIIWRESRGNPLAYNETPIYNAGMENHAQGLCGMALPLHGRFVQGDFSNPEVQMQACYGLYVEQGWTPWDI